MIGGNEIWIWFDWLIDLHKKMFFNEVQQPYHRGDQSARCSLPADVKMLQVGRSNWIQLKKTNEWMNNESIVDYYIRFYLSCGEPRFRRKQKPIRPKRTIFDKYWFLSIFTEFYWLLSNFTEFWNGLLSLIDSYLVLRRFTEFLLVLPNFT